MGEAKRRGTFKQRQAEAMKRDAKLRKKRRLAELKRRTLMTPKERAAEAETIRFLAFLEGIAAASNFKI